MIQNFKYLGISTAKWVFETKKGEYGKYGNQIAQNKLKHNESCK